MGGETGAGGEERGEEKGAGAQRETSVAEATIRTTRRNSIARRTIWTTRSSLLAC